MAGLSLHIATEGHIAPPTNLGGQVLSLGSVYFLGPDLGIFGLELTPDIAFINLEDLFRDTQNPLLVELTNANLEVINAAGGENQSPFDLRIRIGGVAYKIPFAFAKRIKAKNGGIVWWQSTRHPLEADHEGHVHLWRHAPGVF